MQIYSTWIELKLSSSLLTTTNETPSIITSRWHTTTTIFSCWSHPFLISCNTTMTTTIVVVWLIDSIVCLPVTTTTTSSIIWLAMPWISNDGRRFRRRHLLLLLPPPHRYLLPPPNRQHNRNIKFMQQLLVLSLLLPEGRRWRVEKYRSKNGRITSQIKRWVLIQLWLQFNMISVSSLVLVSPLRPPPTSLYKANRVFVPTEITGEDKIVTQILVLPILLLERSVDRQRIFVANDRIHSLNVFAQTVR